MRAMALGTSSGRPTRERNLSAFVVDLGSKWVLFDCGEGTQHQILRYGPGLRRLAGVFITHLHGDHVLGLPGLLSTMGNDGRSAPLVVVGPVGLRGWIDATAALPMLDLPYELHIEELQDGDPAAAGDHPVRVADVEGFRIDSLPLQHRVPTHGFRISEPERRGRFDVTKAEQLGVRPGPDFGRLQEGHDVVVVDGSIVHPSDVLGPSAPGRVVSVCTDTVPCDNGVRLADGADLLVHESTYMESEAELAMRWRHSTAAGAAGVAARASPRRLLLTHFSSRYADVGPLVEEARRTFDATSAAVEGEWMDV